MIGTAKACFDRSAPLLARLPDISAPPTIIITSHPTAISALALHRPFFCVATLIRHLLILTTTPVARTATDDRHANLDA
jgi:hypothetical protein